MEEDDDNPCIIISSLTNQLTLPRKLNRKERELKRTLSNKFFIGSSSNKAFKREYNVPPWWEQLVSYQNEVESFQEPPLPNLEDKTQVLFFVFSRYFIIVLLLLFF